MSTDAGIVPAPRVRAAAASLERPGRDRGGGRRHAPSKAALSIGEIPLLRSLASVLAGYDGPAELERGLGILLAGLTTTPTPQAK